MVVLAVVGGAKAISGITSVDYRSNYRSWQHVKSMIIPPGHPLEDPFGGIHHVYANSKAMSGLTGGTYENGGWGYDTFVGDSTTERIVQDVVVACYGCHTGANESNYVFSRYRP